MTSQFSQASDQFECALRTCCIISKQNASNDLIYREIADPHHWFWLIVNVKGHPIPSPCFIISRWNVSKGLIYFKRGNSHGWFWLTVVESECECQPEFDFIQTWNCWLSYLKDELRRDKTELLAYLKPTIWMKFNVKKVLEKKESTRKNLPERIRKDRSCLISSNVWRLFQRKFDACFKNPKWSSTWFRFLRALVPKKCKTQYLPLNKCWFFIFSYFDFLIFDVRET